MSPTFTSRVTTSGPMMLPLHDGPLSVVVTAASAADLRPLTMWPPVTIVPAPETTKFCLCVYVAPMPATDSGLSLGLCQTIRRPMPNTAPTDAKAACLYPNSWRGVSEVKARGFQFGTICP